MQFLLFVIRLLLVLCPGKVEILEAARQPSPRTSARWSGERQTKVVVLPWLGWLEIDTNYLSFLSRDRYRVGLAKRAGPLHRGRLLRRKG